MPKKFLITFVCLSFVLCLPQSLWAAEDLVLERMDKEAAKALQKNSDYVQSDWTSLLRAMIKYNALDVNDDVLLDDYAQVTECPLYLRYFHDDFQWNRVRKIIRESIAINKKDFPTKLHIDTRLQLDRYNFEKKLYEFTEKTAVNHVNSFKLLSVEGKPCTTDDVVAVPREFRAVTNDPLSIPGLWLEQQDGEKLLHIMDDMGNADHIVFTRFNFSIVYIQNLHKNLVSGSNTKTVYSQSEKSGVNFRIDVKLDSVQFFVDEGMTAQIYAYKPK